MLGTTTHLNIINSHVAMIKYHMHCPIFMACVSAAVMSYPYTVCKLPGCFSYKWPGYEASILFT